LHEVFHQYNINILFTIAALPSRVSMTLTHQQMMAQQAQQEQRQLEVRQQNFPTMYSAQMKHQNNQVKHHDDQIIKVETVSSNVPLKSKKTVNYSN
jgi:hypothetical protein